MTAAATSRHDVEVALGDLPPRGPALGRGGEAVVYDLPSFTLPDAPGPLVYKEYLTRRPTHDVVARIVGLRADLRTEPARLALLDAVAAWPTRLVVDGGEIAGVLMPRVAAEFFCTIKLPRSGAREQVPAEVQFIFVPPRLALHNEYPLPTPEQRLRICRDFARAMQFLHEEINVVIGDVNAKNELIRLENRPTRNPAAAPTVLLIDCDAMHPGRQVGQQMEAPDWEVFPPEPLSRQSDLYKLGLFVLRCLKPDDQPFYVRDPELAAATGMLDAAGMDLLRAAIRGPATQRPTAGKWARHLSRLLGDATDPARLLRATLNKTVAVPGEPVTLDWVAADADVLEVSGAGCPPVSVDATGGAGQVELYPARTGRFTVRAANLLGQDVQVTEPVAVLELLPRHDLPVPVPTFELPRLGAVDLPDVAALFPPVPLPHAAAVSELGDPVGWWTLPYPQMSDAAPALPEPGDVLVGVLGAVPNLLPILTGAPDRDNDPFVRGEVIR